MSVIPTDVGSTKGDAGWQFRTSWQKISEALDRLVVDRSCRAIPATPLRRAGHDRDRRRGLMRQGQWRLAVRTLHARS